LLAARGVVSKACVMRPHLPPSQVCRPPAKPLLAAGVPCCGGAVSKRCCCLFTPSPARLRQVGKSSLCAHPLAQRLTVLTGSLQDPIPLLRLAACLTMLPSSGPARPLARMPPTRCANLSTRPRTSACLLD
jgi:hypothetical protein